MAPRWGFAYPGAQIRNPLVNITSIIRPTPDGEENRPVEELWTVFGSQILGFRVLGSGFWVPGEYPSGCRSSPILASLAPRTRNPEPRTRYRAPKVSGRPVPRFEVGRRKLHADRTRHRLALDFDAAGVGGRNDEGHRRPFRGAWQISERDGDFQDGLDSHVPRER